jgi:hypothetical protein
MAKLKLIAINCEQTEDLTGPDEAYLTMNGQPIWGPETINDQESRSINKTIPFTTIALVKLYDADAGGLDNDDKLGETKIYASEAGKGEQARGFKSQGANYTLFYEVQP